MRKVLVVALVALVAGCGGGSAPKTTPPFQRTLDSLVTGPNRLAPGVTAFVSGPHGTWTGSAGWADATKQVRMQPDARLRLESVSKLWTATVIAKLATEHELGLDDTVEKWLPGVFPYGRLITIRELLNHTSGMVSDNDFELRPKYWLSRLHGPLRAEVLATVAKLEQDRTFVYPTMLLVRMAAAMPLLFEPATGYHYSNIGYITAGVIAERAGHAPLADLYRRIITDPLDLQSAAYAPHGPIPGPHPIGYIVTHGGTAIAATRFDTGGLTAQGGIVVDARDEAQFLLGLVGGKVVPQTMLAQMISGSGPEPTYALGTVVGDTCGGKTLSHGGGGASWSSYVAVSLDGSRVAVMLFNGARTDGGGDYAGALFKLFCAA